MPQTKQPTCANSARTLRSEERRNDDVKTPRPKTWLLDARARAGKIECRKSVWENTMLMPTTGRQRLRLDLGSLRQRWENELGSKLATPVKATRHGSVMRREAKRCPDAHEQWGQKSREEEWEPGNATSGTLSFLSSSWRKNTRNLQQLTAKPGQGQREMDLGQRQRKQKHASIRDQRRTNSIRETGPRNQ